MQVIIVGCGKVGRNLAEQLQAEDIDITLVDVIADKINDLCENIDAMGIVGNGASINTLMEAGVDTADILIAVTASDELNLLCCLIAQKANHCQTIARVRNPIYEKEIGFIKERLGERVRISGQGAGAQRVPSGYPRHEEHTESTLARSRWHTYRQPLQFTFFKPLERVHNRFQHVHSRHIEFLLRLPVPLHIEKIVMKQVRCQHECRLFRKLVELDSGLLV